MGNGRLTEPAKWRHIAREIAANVAMGNALVRSWRVRRGRTVAPTMSLEQRLLSYGFDQFAVLEKAVGPGGLRGKRVLEVGPGDQIPIGLLSIGAGARTYFANDRFPGDIASPGARAFYKELAKRAPASFQQEWRSRGMDPESFPWTEGPEAPVRVVPVPVEHLKESLDEPVDVIFSYNVVEHLADVEQAFSALRTVLAPGGLMVHMVDYGPHQCWVGYRNPLTFLTVPPFFWKLMGSNRGTANRVRHWENRELLLRLGFQIVRDEVFRCDLAHAEEVFPFLRLPRPIPSIEEARVVGALVVATC